MSFCKKCGSELDENNVCPNCATMQHSEFSINKIADFCVNAYEKIVIITFVLMIIVTIIIGGVIAEPLVGILIWVVGSASSVMFCGAMLQIAYIRKSLERIEKRGN